MANRTLPNRDGDQSFTEFEEAELTLMQEKLQILLQKKAQRGTANIMRQGLQGVINRIAEDKLERVKRMIEDDELWKLLDKRGLELANTTLEAWPKRLDTAEQKLQLEDDLKDIANYCDIMVLMLRGQWK